MLIQLLAVLVALAVALPFKPWLPLLHPPMLSPWLGAVVILPFVWTTQRFVPGDLPLHLSGACLLVLMFGWPLAIWTLVPVALIGTFIAGGSPDLYLLADDILWTGVLPASLALLLGLTIRRWLPHHLFVFILGRGFFTTVAAVAATGVLGVLAGRKSQTLGTDEWLLASWLLGWGEAVSTGMLTAIFVAFKPHWLLTYSDARYLPRKPE